MTSVNLQSEHQPTTRLLEGDELDMIAVLHGSPAQRRILSLMIGIAMGDLRDLSASFDFPPSFLAHQPRSIASPIAGAVLSRDEGTQLLDL